MFKPKNYYEVLKPIYFITKIFGLTPFCANNDCYKKSKLNVIWSMTLMLCLTIYATIGLQNKPIGRVGLITKITGILDSYITAIGVSCGILFGCINLNKILNAIRNINTFDLKMSDNFGTNLKKEYQKSSIYILIGLLITIAYISLSFIITIVATKEIFSLEFLGEFISYAAPPIINSFVDFQFCTLILCLKQRFGWLNRKIVQTSHNLEKHLQDYDNIFFVGLIGARVRPTTHSVATGFMQDETVDVIKKIRIRHYELCAVSKLINDAYSIQILLIVMQSFVAIIALLLYAGQHVFLDNEVSLEYLFYVGIQLSLVIVQVVVLVIICSSASSEAHKTGILIHNALSVKLEYKYKQELQSEISSFSLQLLQHNLEFTACRMFNIDETLLFSIVGAITTYLVIVIQFELVDIKKYYD